MNYYDLLGVEKSASADQIKSAFRNKARSTHPDAGGDPEDFKRLNEAYETLKDPGKRAEYDHASSGAGRIHVNINGSHHDIFSNIFRDMHNVFGQEQGPFAGTRTYRRQQRNKDLSIEYTCKLEDTLAEQVKQVSVKQISGDRRLVEIKIPIGVKNGQTIRYHKLGDNTFKELTPGDLHVKINIIPTRFEIDGNNLHLNHTIDCFEAILGTTIQVRTLEGKTLNTNIPPGIQHGMSMGLKGHGLYEFNNPGNRGALLVKVNIKIPENLTQEQLNMIRAIKEVTVET